MVDKTNSILVVGFNTRPLAYSLNKAGYEIYAVDFFGDLDLYPSVKDSLILTKELATNYDSIKNKYAKLFPDFTIKMLEKYPEIDYLIIGSGLDDAYKEREDILNEIHNEKYKIISLNNDVKTIKRARDIEFIFKRLKAHEFRVPFTISYDGLENYSNNIRFPCVLKKKRSAGGINIFNIKNPEEFSAIIKNLKLRQFNPLDWVIQEYIKGIPISCTTISNGKECEVISINQQIIGEQFLNSPKEFMYCGNIVPADLQESDEKQISKLSIMLSIELGLKGINGFDFVLKDHRPFLMEINPRIPGSIRASETSLGLNLMDLHIKSFAQNKWDKIKSQLKSSKFNCYSTKFIFFAPKEIYKTQIVKINNLEGIHDKTEPIRSILKGEPVCTILVKSKAKTESYNKALEIVSNINEIIE